MPLTKGAARYSSERSTWQTPRWLYDLLNREFKFTFDPCPARAETGGLTVDWGKRSFCNPPYGRMLIHWLRKASEESKKGKLVVMLLPARTCTNWWHLYCMTATEVRFINGRLRFIGAKDDAPFPSVIVVMDGRKKIHKTKFVSYMKVINGKKPDGSSLGRNGKDWSAA